MTANCFLFRSSSDGGTIAHLSGDSLRRQYRSACRDDQGSHISNPVSSVFDGYFQAFFQQILAAHPAWRPYNRQARRRRSRASPPTPKRARLAGSGTTWLNWVATTISSTARVGKSPAPPWRKFAASSWAGSAVAEVQVWVKYAVLFPSMPLAGSM